MRYLRVLTLLIVAFIGLTASAAVRAVEPDEMLSNPKLEARARAISKELRCLVCQNESIDQSQAPLAHDLRVLVRQRLLAGDSDNQIINFLVSRYGEFVLLKPPFSWNTLALWGAPPAVFLFGIAMIVIVERRRTARSAAAKTANLTAAEEARLAEILRGEAAPPGPGLARLAPFRQTHERPATPN
ncbi:MAG: cytochrome c-type biogenesis protein [Pseudomonadota bacterium]